MANDNVFAGSLFWLFVLIVSAGQTEKLIKAPQTNVKALIGPARHAGRRHGDDDRRHRRSESRKPELLAGAVLDLRPAVFCKAVEFGRRGLIPHTLAEIRAHRYGDCSRWCTRCTRPACPRTWR
jgi:hypothetical protein